MDTNSIRVSNNLIHMVIYGCFQHAFEIYCGTFKTDWKSFSYSDLLLQQQMFRSIRAKLIGRQEAKPNLMSNVATLFGSKENYPMHIYFSPQEKHWFDFITSMSIKKMRSHYREYLTSVNKKISLNDFKELKDSVNTVEAADFIFHDLGVVPASERRRAARCHARRRN